MNKPLNSKSELANMHIREVINPNNEHLQQKLPKLISEQETIKKRQLYR
jgi:hypothetical protein